MAFPFIVARKRRPTRFSQRQSEVELGPLRGIEGIEVVHLTGGPLIRGSFLPSEHGAFQLVTEVTPKNGCFTRDNPLKMDDN